MAGRVRTALVLGVWLLAAAPTTWAGGRSRALSTPELMVDLARDYGLQKRGQQTEADVKHVRALLQAAVRLDPELADAYTWLYELDALAGDNEEAARDLAGLLRVDPTHESAFASWLIYGVQAQRTAEQRAEWLNAVLATPRPPALESLVRVQLAGVALEQLDNATARRELQAALTLDAANLDAARLMLVALGDNAPAAERLRAALRVLSLNPLSVETTWHVASLLDAYGFASDARRFYDHAELVYRRAHPRGAWPGAFRLDEARNAFARGKSDDAASAAREVIASDPLHAAEAGMFLYHVLMRSGRVQMAGDVKEQLSKRFATLREPTEWPVNEVAQAAWYYCLMDAQPDRALMLAENAAGRAPQDEFVQRVLGWALSQNLRSEDALRTLLPIAGHDAYATWLAAKLLREAGDDARAATVLAALEPKPFVGAAAELLASTDGYVPASQPTESYPDFAAALREFDPRVFDFATDSTRFLDAQVTLDDRSPAPGEPWWAEFSLTNRGPFPITLGADAMVNPVFLISARVEGDRPRDYPALLTVNVDRLRALEPGETVRVRRTIDIGPLRTMSRRTPQQLQRITLLPILDAEADADGQWRPRIAGQALRPVYFNRVPTASSREAIGAYFGIVADGTGRGRWQAIEILGELWGESQQAALKRLSYQPGAVPDSRIRGVFMDLLANDDWEVRVRALDALQLVGLDRQMVESIQVCLQHPHWLVRMMALRVLARQGRVFADQAGSIARNDPDELVRLLASSYVEQWNGPTSAPSAAPARSTPKAADK